MVSFLCVWVEQLQHTILDFLKLHMENRPLSITELKIMEVALMFTMGGHGSMDNPVQIVVRP